MKKRVLLGVKKKEEHHSVAMLQPFRIELSGNCEMDIDGCKKIVAYDSECIKVALPKIILCIYGEALQIRSMSDHALTICGTILRTEFIR